MVPARFLALLTPSGGSPKHIECLPPPSFEPWLSRRDFRRNALLVYS